MGNQNLNSIKFRNNKKIKSIKKNKNYKNQIKSLKIKIFRLKYLIPQKLL